MGIDLYYTMVSPPARATLILAKHLGIDVNLKDVKLLEGETRKPEYLKLNPAHTVPTLVDDGFVLFESRAILQYFVNKYATDKSLYPAEPQARASVDKILYFDASGYFSAFRAVVVARILRKTEPTKEAIEELEEKVKILETLLGEKRFFAGDHVTIADVSLVTSVPLLKFLGASFHSEKLAQWCQRVSEAIPAAAEFNNQAIEMVKKIQETENAANK